MNTVLSKFFNLPPHLKMLLAVAGFGSIAGIIFMLLPALRTKSGKIWILIILGGVLLLVGIIYLIKRMFGKKKAAALEGALESQGPTRGDIAEQQQIYKEKFKSKLAELKANGLSVYKLPWFILMGEPGSGKTASLINSGLDFPLGKDEVPGFGGTRNYNWWFTNNAVILDTAGRIAFHEEGTSDKPEWEHFIKLLKINRPRCPINGVIVAIPADKLLRDSSEETEQKATVLRERLRQIHQLLGVRFPTFVIITKMDLVGGFNEFFDEIRPDLQQRNQMFGWSRPEEFQSSYDTGTFTQCFDEVYERLRDWAMRFLQRTHATEQELGLVVTFPESFRQLRGALNDYISTIFQKSPLLEPPFFRGFYFTSSVQEGTPIFDVFAKSRGASVVEVAATKTVESKAFFIHDFYEKKVFPEQGLVFRSAKHVTLNKRMRRMVWMGSTAMAGLMLLFVIVGGLNFRSLLTKPLDDCANAAGYYPSADESRPKKFEASFADLKGNITKAKALAGHIEKYTGFKRALSARMMFLFANPNVPKELISRIHAKFVMVTIVEPTLSEFADRIRNKKIPVQGGDRKAYLNSLKTLVQWYGEAVGLQQRGKAMTGASPQTRSDEFARILAGLSGDPDPDARLDAVQQVKIALEYLRDDRVFAKDILKTHVATLSDPKTVNAAVAEIGRYYEPRTKVGPGSVDGIEYWYKLFTELDRAGKSYANLLALAKDLADTDKFESTAAVFLTETQDIGQINTSVTSTAGPDTFSGIWAGLPDYLSTQESHLPRFADGRIQRLTELFDDVKKEWEGEFAILEGALAIGAKSGGTTDVESTYTEINARKKSLADSVSKSLEELKSKFGIAGEGDPLKYYEDQSLVLVKRAPDGREHIEMSSGAYGTGAWLVDIIADLRTLAEVGGNERPLPPLAEWPEEIKKMRVQEPAKLATARTFGIWHSNVQRDNAADTSGGRRRNEYMETNARFVKDQTYWKPVKLFGLAESIWEGHKYVIGGRTLARMIDALEQTLDQNPPGLARLVDKFDVKARDLPFDSHRFNRLRRTPAAQPAQNDREEEGRRDGRRRRRSRPAEPDSAEGQTRRQRAADMLLTQYHTREFLVKTLRLYKTIEQSLPQEAKWANLRTALSDSAEKYVLGYFGDWYALYSDYTQLLDVETLDFIAKCRDQKITWPEFQSWMTNRDGGDAMLKTLGKRMEALARETVYFEDMLESNPTDDEIYELIKGQLDVLKGRGASIVEVLDDLRDYQPTEGAAETLIANRMKAALREYLREVKALGDLTKTSKRTLELPDVAKLREQIVDPSYLDLDFRIVAPLIAIAEYGEKLLTHHLESNLAAIIEKHHGHYPLIRGNDIPSPNLDAKKLSDVIESAMSPDDFILLLRETAVFERDFGQVYRSDSSSVVGIATLDKCKLWRDFLYAKKGLSLSGKFEEPERRKLNIVVDTVDHPENTNDCGSICDSLTTSLPVFKIDSNAPINKILVPTRPSKAEQVSTDWAYEWKLTNKADFSRASVALQQVDPRQATRGWQDGKTAWELPGNAWTLPLLLRSVTSTDEGARVRIPVIFKNNANNRCGAFINIRFETPFPGPIPMLPQTRALAGMDNGSDFVPLGSGE